MGGEARKRGKIKGIEQEGKELKGMEKEEKKGKYKRE